MNDIVKFAETVQQMRSAQNEYFRTKAPVAMAKSKKLEKEVDEMVKGAVRAPLISQGSIFGKSLPATDPDLKHEIKFCLLQEMDINEHGQFIYISSTGAHSISMPYFLSDYRDWLKNQGLTKDYQRA